MMKAKGPFRSRKQFHRGLLRFTPKWKNLFLSPIFFLLLVNISWADIPSCDISRYELLSRDIGDVGEPYRSMGLKIVRCHFFCKDQGEGIERIYFQCLFKPSDGKLMPIGIGHIDDLIVSRQTPMKTYMWRFEFDQDWGLNWANYMEMDGRVIEVATHMDSEGYKERIEELLKNIFVKINEKPYYEESI